MVTETQSRVVPDGMIGKAIGHYLVRRKLAEGGMGAVYLAEHPAIGKRVALKVLHTRFSAQPEIVSRFFHEAKAVNDVQHPNIVDIVDFGLMPSPIPGEPPRVYLLMEYLEGMTLGAVIRRDAPLSTERTVAIALPIADALAASHQRGIIHRDLKPDNVMLVSRGRQHELVKLLDFGVAKLTLNANTTHRTQTGTVIGTPRYMSPEQCEGRKIDDRTDVYALGIVIYEMLTGRVPFVGESFGDVLVQQIATPPLAPSAIIPQLPEHLELVVLKALEKRADHRYPHMTDMALALQDPVRYVETHGGKARFLASPIRRDPAAHAASMPTTMLAISGPGVERAIPTTLGGTAAQLTGAGVSSRGMRVGVALWMAAALAVAGAAVGVTARTREDPPEGTATGRQATQPAVPAPRDIEQRQPRTVRVAIDSRPAGAAVIIGGETRGTTPYVAELGRDGAPIEVELRLAGYLPAIRTIALDTDVVLSLPLDRAPALAPRPAAASPSAVGPR
jgi:serine/threonine-protein kinase